MIWTVYCCLVLCVMESISDEIESTTGSFDDYCEDIKCVGVEYSCRNRKCYCAEGYFPNYSHDKCIKCPGLGENCNEKCCSNTSGNKTLTCWEGVCQKCHDKYGNWICRGSLKESLLITNTKIVIDTAVLLVFLVTFVLVFKVCTAKNLRPMSQHSTLSNNPRLSVGSLQLYIEDRLRDAPPKYSLEPPSDAPHPFTIYLNGFVHDSSIPPPPYIPEDITWDRKNAILHI